LQRDISGKDTTTHKELLPPFDHTLVRRGETRCSAFAGAQLAEQARPCKPGGWREGSAAELEKTQLKRSLICILLPTIPLKKLHHF